MRRESLKAVEEMFNRKLIKVEPPYPWPDPPGWEGKAGSSAGSSRKGKGSSARRKNGRKRYP